jgi:RimJ/RimL family protein N-acetyltransferase
MITWNLQSACLSPGHPNASQQPCQAGGFLPTRPSLAAWAPAPNASDWLAIALDMRERLGAMPFVVREMHDGKPGKVVGATRLFNVDEANRRLEIGHTWYAKSVQRTGINTECKLLLLTHAFETLRCIAVEFRTHWMNHQSRAAIARLGAKQDGVLRNHQRMPDGSFRDTVVFSIIESEWLTVKRHLQYKLEQPR